MKLKKLHINNFRHLENLEFNFTYPENYHIEEKRGKPLDKICIIGQSATGKTGILELIYYQNSIYDFKQKIKESDFDLQFENDNNNDSIIYFQSEIDLSIFGRIFNKNYSNIFNNAIEKRNIEIKINEYIKKERKIINDKIEILWDFILFELQDYSEKLKILGNQITKQLNFDNINVIIENWNKENNNPYLDLGENYLNNILNKVNLELNTNLEKNSLITLKDKKSDKILTMSELSTGTKNLIATILPLYRLNTDDGIILIDEPERSLYPDIQMELMDLYQKIAPKAQFIIATHSPFIAASFEPEERFILYFDSEGKVKVKQGTSPIGDDPNDMLYNDFEVDYINNFGKEKYKEYVDLKQKIHFEKDENKILEISKKLEELGEKYNF